MVYILETAGMNKIEYRVVKITDEYACNVFNNWGRNPVEDREMYNQMVELVKEQFNVGKYTTNWEEAEFYAGNMDRYKDPIKLSVMMVF